LSITQLFHQEKDFPRIDLIALISLVTSLSKEQILMEPDRALTDEEWASMQTLLEERRRCKPIAYITHEKEFFSERFYVDERVLIPRPETETLVEEAIKFMQERKEPVRVLDMGTGSGIIGIMCARNGANHVLCIDKSPAALDVARRNGAALHMEERPALLCSDLFASVKKAPLFDLVCANLPYISEEEWQDLMDDVRLFEPEEALLGGQKGIEVYERFIADLRGRLSPGAAVLCEIGSSSQADMLCGMMKTIGFETAIKKDLSGQQRVVKALWINS
jgi:release factor glutamine methyltransferase